METPNKSPFPFLAQDWDIGNRVCRYHQAPLFVVAIRLVHLGTEIVRGHSVENDVNFENQGMLTLYSNFPLNVLLFNNLHAYINT